MRNLLIISPHFPPTNAADMHRVRMMLPHLPACGWDVQVLAARPELSDQPQESALESLLPNPVNVERVGGIPKGVGRWLGVQTLSRRIKPFIHRTAKRLIKQQKFDLVFFSTTCFGLLPLAAKWQLPYVLDWQDPWYSDYYEQHPEVPPPGGRLKYWLANRQARSMEPQVVHGASGIVCVSSSYEAQLKSRYGVPDDRLLTEPFGFSLADFKRAEQLAGEPTRSELLYVGRCGEIMHDSVLTLLQALRELGSRAPRLDLVGTEYSSSVKEGFATVLAKELGAEDLVREQTDRIGYVESLHRLNGAQTLLIFGSSDTAYNPSKLWTYAALNKRLLVLCSEGSELHRQSQQLANASIVLTNRSDAVSRCIEALLSNHVSPLNFKPDLTHEAARMTARLCSFFERCLR